MSTKAEAKVNEETIVEIDTSGMEKRINDNIDVKMKKYKEELQTYQKEAIEKRDRGKGLVESFGEDRKKVIIEELKKGANADIHKLNEQWTIAIPAKAVYEVAGHLRDYVFVSDVVKGKPGEQVNIPYVKDVEFTHQATGTGTAGLTAVTGLVAVLTTTLHESGAYYDAYYNDIEKIDANLLDELNRVFAHAAVRAEDADLLDLLMACTTCDFASTDGKTGYCEVGDTAVNLTDTKFDPRWIADAVGEMLKKGKDVHPGECIIYMPARAYAGLLRQLVTSQVIAFARSDLIQKGIVEDYLGVKIVVGGYETREKDGEAKGKGLANTSYEVCYLMRPKRALALAPKRDILIETDKIIANRQLRIAASHVYGVCLIDATEAVRIWCNILGVTT